MTWLNQTQTCSLMFVYLWFISRKCNKILAKLVLLIYSLLISLGPFLMDFAAYNAIDIISVFRLNMSLLITFEGHLHVQKQYSLSCIRITFICGIIHDNSTVAAGILQCCLVKGSLFTGIYVGCSIPLVFSGFSSNRIELACWILKNWPDVISTA